MKYHTYPEQENGKTEKCFWCDNEEIGDTDYCIMCGLETQKLSNFYYSKPAYSIRTQDNIYFF